MAPSCLRGLGAVARYLGDCQGGAGDEAAAAAILAGLGWPPDMPLGDPGKPDADKRLARIAAFCAMAPSFQTA